MQFHPRILHRGHKRHKHPQGLQQRRHRLTNEGLVEVHSPRGSSPSGRKGQRACKKSSKELVRISSCDNWLPFVCQNYKSDRDAHSATTDCSDTLRAMGGPVISRREVVRKDQLRLNVWVVCLREDLFKGKRRNLGSNHTIKFSQGTLHHVKIRERKGPSQGVMHKCEPQERNPCAPKIEEITQDETWKQRVMRPQRSTRLCEICLQAIKKGKNYFFYSPSEAWVMPASSSKSPEAREFVVDSGASMRKVSKKVLSSGELETFRKSRNPTTVVTANGDVQTNEEVQNFVHDLELFVTVQSFEDTPPVLSLGKLCEEHGYSYASGQKPQLTKVKHFLCQSEIFVLKVVPGLSTSSSSSTASSSSTSLPQRRLVVSFQVQQHNEVTTQTLRH